MEEAETLLGDLNKATLKYGSFTQDLEVTRTEVGERDARIAQIKSIEGLIDDDEARNIRAGRDDLWRIHRANLTEQTADAFEGSMKHVDRATDLRLSQASDLGTLRQQEQDLAAAKAKMASIEKQIAALDQERRDVLARLAGAAEESGIGASATPELFVAWLRKLESAGQVDRELRRLQDEHQETFQRAARLVEVLSEHIRRDTPEFDELVAVARINLEAQRSYQENLRNAKTRIAELARDRAKRADKLLDLEKTAVDTRNDWFGLVKRVLPERLDAGVLEASLQALQELREHEKERILLDRQVGAMEADQILFADKVKDLATRVGVVTTTSPLADYDALKALAKLAADAEEQDRELNKQITTHEQLLADAQDVLKKIDLAVAELARAFPACVDTSSLGALRKAVNTATSVIADRDRRADLEKSLKSLLELDGVDEARAALAEATQTGLQAELNEVSVDLEGIEHRYKGAIEARTNADQQLRAIGGDADVALLVERKTTLELEMQETALRHLELSLGHRLAETAIRRYRDEHRSAMMQATETAFAELTNGAYSKLQTQIDGASETLLALDASGVAKQAQDMSKGTRFQLYLALRAAAYEQLADQGAALPFFCDDIFETFDEERTRSACRLMQRIGRRGQAIYLTHHQHVVDIAREICGEDVQIHSIAS